MAKRPPSEVLADFDQLPDSVLVEDSVAADVLGTSRGALAVWRHLRKGPDFVRLGDRVRYRVGTLRQAIADGTVKCETVFTQDEVDDDDRRLIASAGRSCVGLAPALK
jgi:hypothetical protein